MILKTPETIEFMRIYLAVFFSLVAVFYTARIILLKRKTSSELVFAGKRFCSTWWNHMVFRFFRIAIWMVCLMRVFFPSIDNYLGVIKRLELTGVILTGGSLLTFGFIATVVVHLRFGKHWRSGIDPAGPKSIITTGMYQYSRNPMFCFVMIAQIGFFLAIPSIFSMLCLFTGCFTLARQVKAEETHLLVRFPKEFLEYKRKVRRWI